MIRDHMDTEINEDGRPFHFYREPLTLTQAIVNAYERQSQRDWAARDKRQRVDDLQRQLDADIDAFVAGLLIAVLVAGIIGLIVMVISMWR